MKTNRVAKMILKLITAEINNNPSLMEQIIQTLDQNVKADDKNEPPHPHRREPGVFDPLQVYREQPETLKSKLSILDIEQLKDIIAEQGIDRTKLAMKWKSKERMIELIIKTVESRSQKGDAFRVG